MALPGEKLQLQKTVHSSLYSLESACWLRTTLTLTNYRLILSIDGPAAGIDPSLISSEEYKKQQRISKLKVDIYFVSRLSFSFTLCANVRFLCIVVLQQTKLGRNSISVCAILDSKEAESVDPAERRKIKKLQVRRHPPLFLCYSLVTKCNSILIARHSVFAPVCVFM